MKRFFLYWVPVLIWMVFIFSLSAQQTIAIGRTYWQDVAIKKTLHVIEYAVLYFLLFRAFRRTKCASGTGTVSFLFAFLSSLIYATTDEIHQTFVLTREGVIRDVAIDFVGMVIMYIYIKTRMRTLRKLL